MNYRIEFEKRAIRQYKKLDPQIRKKVANKINTLREDPQRYPFLSRTLAELRKIVVPTPGGEYRIVFALDEKMKAIDVVFVGSRENFYRELQRYLG